MSDTHKHISSLFLKLIRPVIEYHVPDFLLPFLDQRSEYFFCNGHNDSFFQCKNTNLFIIVKQLLIFLFNDTKQIYETRKRKESALYTFSRDNCGAIIQFSPQICGANENFSPQNKGVLFLQLLQFCKMICLLPLNNSIHYCLIALNNCMI